MEKTIQMFRESLQNQAVRQGCDDITRCIKAVLSFPESSLTGEKFTESRNDLIHIASQQESSYERQYENASPYPELLHAYVSEHTVEPCEENQVWFEDVSSVFPEKETYSTTYAKKVKDMLESCASEGGETRNTFVRASKLVDSVVEEGKSFDVVNFPRFTYERGLSDEDTLSKKEEQESFRIINEAMKTHLSESAMNGYNMALFYVPAIENFQEKVNDILRSDICKNNRDIVGAKVAVATFEAAMNQVVHPIDAERILQVLEDVTVNEFSVAAMLPQLGSTEGFDTKLAKTPVEKVVKRTNDTVNLKADREEFDSLMKESVFDFFEFLLECHSEKVITENVFPLCESVFFRKPFAGNIDAMRDGSRIGMIKNPENKLSVMKESPSADVSYGIGFTLLENRVSPDSLLMEAFESYSGIATDTLVKKFLETAEDNNTNGIFENEAKKIYYKVFRFTGIKPAERDLNFQRKMSPDKSHVAIYITDKSQGVSTQVITSLTSNGYKKVIDPKIKGTRYEKTVKNIVIEAIYEESDGRLQMSYKKKDAGTVVKEAANIDEDIKDVILALNRKGYITKYSCSGHPESYVKGDLNKDNVKNGKLYTTARITFAGLHHFKNIPEHWRLSEKDGKTTIFAKEYSYGEHQGSGDEAFKKWKEMYMIELREWVGKLPKIGTDNGPKEEEPKDVKESVSFSSMFDEMYYRNGYGMTSR